MSAFNFDLCDNSKCISKDYTTSVYMHGSFYINQRKVGDRHRWNKGGKGGFVGPEHEYFLYCGSKFAEIALAKFNADTDDWENHALLQWSGKRHPGRRGYFNEIWFTKEKKPALIFKPWNEYRDFLLAHKDLGSPSNLNGYIKLDLCTGRFKGITSPTAKRDTQGDETLLHQNRKISFYCRSLVLRST
jgi:hypothetical protein